MELAPHHAFQQCEFIRKVIVKRGPVESRRFGDVLDRYFLELLLRQYLSQCLPQHLAGSPDARIERLAASLDHGYYVRVQRLSNRRVNNSCRFCESTDVA